MTLSPDGHDHSYWTQTSPSRRMINDQMRNIRFGHRNQTMTPAVRFFENCFEKCATDTKLDRYLHLDRRNSYSTCAGPGVVAAWVALLFQSLKTLLKLDDLRHKHKKTAVTLAGRQSFVLNYKQKRVCGLNPYNNMKPDWLHLTGKGHHSHKGHYSRKSWSLRLYSPKAVRSTLAALPPPTVPTYYFMFKAYSSLWRRP